MNIADRVHVLMLVDETTLAVSVPEGVISRRLRESF